MVDWCVLGPCVPLPGQGKVFPADRGHNPQGRDCATSLPSSVLLRVFSCCPHHFVGQVLLGTGWCSPTESASWPRQLEECVFY